MGKKIIMKYCAIYMPSIDGIDPSRCGFKSEKEAWKFIYSRSCEDCQMSGIDRCSAEWDVGTEEQWKEFGMVIDENSNIINK